MIHNTNQEVKQANFKTFSELIEGQFKHGGAKYKATGEKEMTDLICETFPGDSGVDWALGTMMKYLARYKNFGREKDLLKLATYSYILWLKGGFHLLDRKFHDEDTNVDGSSKIIENN
jgi:hypothetical protein